MGGSTKCKHHHISVGENINLQCKFEFLPGEMQWAWAKTTWFGFCPFPHGSGWDGVVGQVGGVDLEMHIFPGPPISASQNLFEHK